jgi:hypothetical protein
MVKKVILVAALLVGFLYIADIALERTTGIGLFMRLGY